MPTPKRYIAGYEDGKYIWGTRSGYDKTDTALDTYQASYEKDMGRNWTLTTDIFADKGHFINNAYDDDQTTERKTRGMHVRADHTYGQDSHLLIGADWIKQEQNLDYVGSVRTGTMYHFNYDRKTEGKRLTGHSLMWEIMYPEMIRLIAGILQGNCRRLTTTMTPAVSMSGMNEATPVRMPFR